MKLELKDGHITNVATGETIARKDAFQESEGLTDGKWARVYAEMLLEDNIKLTGSQSLLLWYCVSKMNSNGKIKIDKETKNGGAQKYTGNTKRTIGAYILRFQKLELMFPTADQGVFLMNPRYFGMYKEKNIVMLKYALMMVDGKTYELKEFGLQKKKQTEDESGEAEEINK